MRSPIVTRNDLSATVGRPSTRSSASATLAPREIERAARRRHRLRALRVMRGGLPSTISSGTSTGGGPPRSSASVSRPSGVARAELRPRRALACAQRGEVGDALVGDRHHVALLRFVAPQLERRQVGLAGRNLAQLEARAEAGVVDELGHRVRQAARADVVDRQDRVASPIAQQRSITSWQRRWISALSRCTDAKSRSSADAPCASELAAPPPRPIKNAGPPSTTSAAPAGTCAFCTCAARIAPMPPASIPACDSRGSPKLERAEVAEDRGPTELVVERGAAERAFGHDVERGRDARRRANPLGVLPRLERAGDAQVGDRETDETGLGLAAAPGRAFVANLAARAGRGAGERRNRRRVVVRLDLAEDVRRLVVRAVHAVGVGERTAPRRAPSTTAALSLYADSTPAGAARGRTA